MRKWARLLTAAILVGVAGLYPLLAPPPHRIDQAHFDRITNGMTREQVESIFGVPAGEYDWAQPVEGAEFLLVLLQTHELHGISDHVADILRDWHQVSRDDCRFCAWTSRCGIFIVALDDQNRVVSMRMSPEVRIVPPWQRWWRDWKK